VVIRDLYFVRAILFPDETNAELAVDANAVLASPVALQYLQPIAGWNSQFVKVYRRFNLK
jgi:hypothetical protein